MIRMLNLMVGISTGLLLVSCNSSDNKKTAAAPTDSTVKETTVLDTATANPAPAKNIAIDTAALEQRILDTVFSLPEVKERADYIEKQTGGKRHLQLLISGKPEELNQDYYEVRAGEDNGDSFVPHFTFYVYPKTFEIKFYDVVDDSAVGLAEWRASGKKEEK